MSDPGWPAEYRKRKIRERWQFSSFPRELRRRDLRTLGTWRNGTQLDDHMSTTAQDHLTAPDLLPIPNWRCVQYDSRYLTGARQSKCWALWKAINIPEQMCYPQERPLPGAPGHWARCRLVPMTSGSHLQIGYQQVKAALTGAVTFINGIGFTNYLQNILKWNIKFPIPLQTPSGVERRKAQIPLFLIAISPLQ